MRISEFGGEVRRLLRARPVQTVLVAGLAATVVVSVLMTVGRTVALEQAVRARTETAEARTILIVDTGQQDLIRLEVVRMLARTGGVDRVVATASPVDAVNVHLGAGSNQIPVWSVDGDILDMAVLRTGRLPQPGEALVSETALTEVGLAGPAGALSIEGGVEFPVVGTFDARPPFTDMSAGALWWHPDQPDGWRRLHIVADALSQVDQVTAAALGFFDATSLQDLRVERSAALADLQELVAGDISRFGRELVLLVLLAGMLLVALVVLSEVLSRRKDFGRQRALGARRSVVILLLAARTAAASCLGVVAGLTGGLLYLSSIGELPPAGFIGGLAVLAILAPMLAATLPAWWAAQRDPVLELRTP